MFGAFNEALLVKEGDVNTDPLPGAPLEDWDTTDAETGTAICCNEW